MRSSLQLLGRFGGRARGHGGAERARGRGRAGGSDHVRRVKTLTEAIDRERSVFHDAMLGVDNTIVCDGLATPISLSATKAVTGQSLFRNSCVLRSTSHARERLKACVVGGTTAIRRIWHEYDVRPTCVYMPDDMEVPEWCYHPTKPTVIVRTDPVMINDDLLSSNQCDGFAAEFELPVMPSMLDLVERTAVDRDAAVGDTAQQEDGQSQPVKLSRVVALHKTRNASNVGNILRAAVDLGYDSVVLDRCADVFNEKVLRASQGAPFCQRLRTYSLSERAEVNTIDLLQQTAVTHKLLPIMAVPDPAAEPVFTVAQRLHYHNHGRPADDDERLGAMIVLGSEASGLDELMDEWQIPAKATSINLDNSLVESINVAHAASIVMHHFRPRATAEFSKLFAKGVVPQSDEPDDALMQLAERDRALSPSAAAQ